VDRCQWLSILVKNSHVVQFHAGEMTYLAQACLLVLAKMRMLPIIGCTLVDGG
jgi:hypothetical protein